ncbi:amidohydrolase family protein [Echinicola jeungdonensis]|uniref:Amidohydrolase family protein n=1 Tax=Echinicola jeungdonensis TaxID=709343 RepID=A0ABV5J5C5_9BACT|nr:amidohydrolase family protein [Echinicola jeungdonensis]MDN3670844.1 amidohydrolase family protein [Echinicola jeungdonensis]
MLKRLNALIQLLVWFFFLQSSLSLAQSDNTGKKRITGTYAITNATIIPSPGKIISNATLVFKDGLIIEVGKNPNIPIDAKEIKGDSLYVYPGFISLAANIAVCEPEKIKKPDDFDPINPPSDYGGITPYRNAIDYWNPKSEEISQWRGLGFTMAQILPYGELLPGKTALVIHGDNSNSNYVIKDSGLFSQFRTRRRTYPGTTLGMMAKWRELYQKAQLALERDKTFINEISGVTRPNRDPVLEALYPVIDKKSPVVFEVDNELEMLRALKLKKELGFSLLLTDVHEGKHLIPEIKQSGAHVALSLKLPEDKPSQKELEDPTPTQKANLLRVQAAYKDALQLAGSFESAKIPFGFSTQRLDKGDFIKNIRLMINQGLSESGALAALTLNAANILGISEYCGSIEKGKWANLVVTTDSLFKENSEIKFVVADGYVFELEDSEAKSAKTKALEGKWEYTSETPGGKSSGIITLRKETDDWKGTITIDDPEGSGKITKMLDDIEVDGEMVNFSFKVMVKGQFLVVKIEGKWSAEKIEGEMKVKDFGNFPIKAKKKPETSAKSWKL